MEWKLIEKEAVIDKLNLRVKNMKQNFRESLNTYLEQFSLSSLDHSTHN